MTRVSYSAKVKSQNPKGPGFFMTNPEIRVNDPSDTAPESFSPADQILSQLNKTVIMKTGVMYLSGEYSTWIINHTNFGYSCKSKVYFSWLKQQRVTKMYSEV